MSTTERILVGYDGSPQSRHAVDWAVTMAEKTGTPLEVVMIHEPVTMWEMSSAHAAVYAADLSSVRASERAHLADLVDDLGRENPGVDLSGSYVESPAARYLVEASARPGLVVLGTRGLGGVKASIMGGVADEVVTHARGPVAVVPETAWTPGAVVVGIDDEGSSDAAFRQGLETARLLGAPVHLVHCLDTHRHIPASNALAVLPADGEPGFPEAHKNLNRLVDEARAWDAQVEVHTQVCVGPPARTLVEASADAGLVVVGSRGRGGFTGLLLGSTSRATLRDTRCPAIVVPAPAD